MMTSTLEPQGQSQHGRERGPTAGGPVERAEPSQVAFQIRRGHPSEAMHPALEPAVIRVGVLDVPGPAHAFACTQIHGFVVHAHFFGGRGHRCRAIRAKNSVGLDAPAERLAQTP